MGILRKRTQLRHLLRRAALLLGALALPVGAFAHGEQHDPKTPPVVLAPGYAELTFEAPAAGSYELPVLGVAGDGEVLGSDGSAIRLASLLGDKPVLMSFVYTSCDDVNGCPLATYVLSQVARRIHDDPELRGAVRFVSLSFDPMNDTPQVMADYGGNFRPDGADWRFLTCDSNEQLDPILASYNQTVAMEYDAGGNPSGRYSHILRVYLIDAARQIRNIYSVSFLHADTIVNDIKTVIAQRGGAAPMPVALDGNTLHGAGDNKDGYATSDYATRSGHLPNRRGVARDLLALTNPPPLGLPALDVPADNPLSPAKVALGRKLFFDRRLSLNQTISCAMCHVPEQGFAHNELAMAVGLEGRTVRRNAPTLYNVGYMRRLFHDGRDDRLEHQVWQPLLAFNEMANPSISAVVNRIAALADYAGLFEQAFDGEAAGIMTIGKALASYERTIVSANSPFDRWHFGGETAAVGEDVKRGFAIFTGKGNCSSCHLVGDDHALFTDHGVHNTGIGYERSMRPAPSEPQRVLLAPGVFIDVDPTAVADSAETPPADLGFYEITQDPADRWKYRTPSLRNVALTAPYMHDGSLTSLEAVIEFYAGGGIDNELLDPLIKPLTLSSQERADLAAFLRSLTGDSVDALISDAFAAPVGNATRGTDRD